MKSRTGADLRQQGEAEGEDLSCSKDRARTSANGGRGSNNNIWCFIQQGKYFSDPLYI